MSGIDDIQAAITSNDLKLVEKLVKNGANIEIGFLTACYWGNLRIVKYLVEQGADIHANSDESLYWSTTNKRLEVVDYLNNRILLEKLTCI